VIGRVVGLSIFGVRGRHHAEQRDIDVARKSIPSFDRDLIVIPEIVVDAEQLTLEMSGVLQPIFHTMWQAGGHQGCPR
jgi:hypothetical protein